MTSSENAVRDAAVQLHDAIVAAQADGYRVDWPATPAGLQSIAVSETAKVGAVARPAPGDEYDAMTKASLSELAAARAIEVPSGATKADIIALLKSPPAPVVT